MFLLAGHRGLSTTRGATSVLHGDEMAHMEHTTQVEVEMDALVE
jgi:hypothetical protein